jgi:hypothetical protein
VLIQRTKVLYAHCNATYVLTKGDVRDTLGREYLLDSNYMLYYLLEACWRTAAKYLRRSSTSARSRRLSMVGNYFQELHEMLQPGFL